MFLSRVVFVSIYCKFYNVILTLPLFAMFEIVKTSFPFKVLSPFNLK